MALRREAKTKPENLQIKSQKWKEGRKQDDVASTGNTMKLKSEDDCQTSFIIQLEIWVCRQA